MARVLVTEKLAERGLKPLADAGHEVDVQLDLDPEALLGAIVGAHAPDRPLGHPGHRRRPRGGHRSHRGGPGRHRARQRRRRGGHPARRHGRERPRVERPLRRRARHGPAAGPGPQHPPGPRRAGGGEVGALEVGGGRAARQDPRRRRARPDRRPRGAAGARLRHAPVRVRPLRLARPGPAHGRRAALARRARGRVRLPHHPSAQDGGDGRAHRRRAPRQGQARHPHRQRGTGWHRRRGGPGRRAARRAGSAGPPSTSSPPSRAPTRRSSRSPRSSSPRTSGASTAEAQDKAGRDHRRAGEPGPGRGLRALRRQRRRHGGLRDRPSLPPPGRAARPVLRLPQRRPARAPRGRVPGRPGRRPTPRSSPWRC